MNSASEDFYTLFCGLGATNILEGEEMHAYCLFCETQRCRDIAAILKNKYGLRCFSPQIIQRKWVRGVALDESHDWLPGYIFVYTEEPANMYFPQVKGIIRCLGKDELAGQDRRFADMLYQKNGVMNTVKLVQIGDRCRVADPSWEKVRGTVVKLDRGRKRCCVEFEFDGIRRSVWVGYDMVDPEASGRAAADPGN